MLEELKEANSYISSKIDKYRSRSLLIKEIEEDAEINNVPIISKEIREYLKFIIKSNKNIKNILEIGTATAYSGIIMAEEIQDRNGCLTTIEIDEDRFKIAKSNFEKANLKNIEQILGDATEEIEKLNKNYDQGGLVFIDNILFRGYLYKESPKRFKTIVKRLDEFIEYLYENFEDVTLLPISDGVMLVNKN